MAKAKTKKPTFGQLVAAYRAALGLSYRQAQDASGVDKAAIVRAEQGSAPKIENFARLCNWAGIDANAVLHEFAA